MLQNGNEQREENGDDEEDGEEEKVATKEKEELKEKQNDVHTLMMIYEDKPLKSTRDGFLQNKTR